MSQTFNVRPHVQGRSSLSGSIEVKGAPLTVIVAGPNVDSVDVLDADVMLIDPELTVKTMREWHPDIWAKIAKTPRFIRLWRKVYPESDPPVSLENAGLDTLHVAGMIMLVTLAMILGKRSHIRFPETYLHPAQQCGLADLFKEMQGASKS